MGMHQRLVDHNVDHLASYRDHSAEWAKQGAPFAFLGTSPEVEAIIIENIIRSSKTRIDIATTKLDEDIFAAPRLIDAAIAFAKRNPDAKITVATKTDIAPDHPLLRAMRETNLTNHIAVKKVDPETSIPNNLNLVLGDDSRFYLHNKADAEGVGSYNDRPSTTHLKDVFDRLKIA